MEKDDNLFIFCLFIFEISADLIYNFKTTIQNESVRESFNSYSGLFASFILSLMAIGCIAEDVLNKINFNSYKEKYKIISRGSKYIEYFFYSLIVLSIIGFILSLIYYYQFYLLVFFI
jgi:hypothetical protein